MEKWAALYLRVSTDAQFEEGYSIDAQKELLEGFCKSKEIKNYKFYIDGGYSGSNIDRPEMQRMIDDIRAGKVSLVAVYKLDRLSRSQKDTLYLIEDIFNPNGTDFVSLNENMDTSTPIGRAMLGIMSAFAQLERETIKMRTRMGMLERVKNGYWMGGGKIPFGYDYDPQKGILVQNEDADTVRKIYELYIAGRSPNYIARLLGIKYERLVLQILKRPSNTGRIVYKGEEYKGLHQPIVSDETYEMAMQVMRERALSRPHTSDFLLSGLVFCGRCGAKMRYQKWGKKGYKLSCYSQQKSKPYLIRDPNCDNVKPWAEQIEEAVTGDLLRISLENPAKGESVDETLAILEKNYEKLVQKQKRLYNLYAEGGEDILLDTINENKKAMDEQKKLIESEKKEALISKKAEKMRKKIEKVSNIWNDMTHLERQKLVRDCVERVVIDGQKVEIHYKFK